jgi:taurine dioxygenase
LDIGAQKRLTGAFGPVIRDDYITPMEDDPFVIRVLKEADDEGGTFGGDWHSDLSFLAEPPAGSVLNGVEIPAFGGDTVWASQMAAWEALPEPLQRLLDGRDAIHVGKPYGVKWAPPPGRRSNVSMRRGDPAADAERRHPAVFTHPRTGRRGLFVNPTYTVRLDGLTEAESRPLLEQIQAHIIRPEFQARLRWRSGTVAVWDNFQTQHYAVNDYFGHRRLMYRTTFGGPPPAR